MNSRTPWCRREVQQVRVEQTDATSTSCHCTSPIFDLLQRRVTDGVDQERKILNTPTGCGRPGRRCHPSVRSLLQTQTGGTDLGIRILGLLCCQIISPRRDFERPIDVDNG